MNGYTSFHIAPLADGSSFPGTLAPDITSLYGGMPVNSIITLPQIMAIILPLVKYIITGLSVFLITLAIFYLLSIHRHHKQRRYMEWKKTYCHRHIGQVLAEGFPVANLKFSPRERKCFRDAMVDIYPQQEPPVQRAMQRLYKNLGFLDDDIKQLRSRAWWRRVMAIERLGVLEMKAAENHMFPLLTDRSEVRFAALRVLVTMGSRRLGKMLPEIFADNSRWAYRFLVNTLAEAKIPVASLRPLAASADRDYRKAAAILLGREGNDEAIPLLKQLAGDTVKDIRRESVLSLGRIGSVKAVPILADKSGDGNSQVRAGVATALREMKTREAVPLLDKLAEDPDFDVRLQAFFALSRLGKPGEAIISKYQARYPEMVEEFIKEVRSGKDAA